MKNIISILIVISLGILPSNFLFASPNIDPLKFSLTTNAVQLNLNEEFEITITAKYLSIPVNSALILEGSNSFRLNLIMPDGFEQTGGNFHSSISGELSERNPDVMYFIKGKFTRQISEGTFQLLRSHSRADNRSQYVQVDKMKFTALEPGKTSVGQRIVVADPIKYVPYISITKLRSSGADSAAVVYITDKGKCGMFALDSLDSTTPDDSSLTILYSSMRYKRVADYVTPEMFGAIGDGINDDTPFLKKAMQPGRKVALIGKYLVTSSINVVFVDDKSLTIFGNEGSEILFNGYFSCLKFASASSYGQVKIENVIISGTMASAYDDIKYGSGIYTDGINSISIGRSCFNNIYGNGIFLTNTTGSITVTGNSIFNCGGLNPTIDSPSGLLDHYGDGILAWTNCKSVLVSSNTIKFNAAAKGYFGRGGIVFDNNCSGVIENNNISGYSRGIHIEYNKDGSSVFGNRITASACGMILSESSDNRIWNNYFSNEGAPNAHSVVGQYFINNYGSNERNVFSNNTVIVDTTAGHVPEMILYGSGKDYLFEKNTILGTRIHIYGTSGYVFRNNIIKSTELTHTNSNTLFESNLIDCKMYTYGSTSARFVGNVIKNSRAGQGVTCLIGYNSNNFALINNRIYNPSSYLIGNDGSAFYGEVSGNTVYTDSTSYSNFWAWFTPYFNRVPMFTRERNVEIRNGIKNSVGFYYSGVYDQDGVSVTWASTPPLTGGPWSVGDKIFNIAPSSGSYMGWVCTGAGSPGTWKGYGEIAP
jgi:hypothetical protein